MTEKTDDTRWVSEFWAKNEEAARRILLPEETPDDRIRRDWGAE